MKSVDSKCILLSFTSGVDTFGNVTSMTLQPEWNTFFWSSTVNVIGFLIEQWSGRSPITVMPEKIYNLFQFVVNEAMEKAHFRTNLPWLLFLSLHFISQEKSFFDIQINHKHYVYNYLF